MKYIVIIFIFISTFGNAQIILPVDTETNMVSFVHIINADSGCTKDLLFNSISVKIASVYNNSQKVVQYSDKASGEIVCKGNFSMWGTIAPCGIWHYTLKISIKDYKYRIIITDIYSEIDPGKSFPEPTAEQLNDKERMYWKQWKNEIIKNTGHIIASFSSVKCSNKSEW